MTPRGMSPMNVQMMQQMQNPVMTPQGYMRHFDHNTGQWVHSGAHTPLRHLPPQAIMAQQNMGMSYMEQYNMQQTPEPPQPPPKPKKRTKKKKEKAPVVETPTPMEPQVNLENFPPHLRFGGNQNAGGPEFQGPPGHGPGSFEYNEHFRQSMQMPGIPNPLTKNYKPGNSPLLKSPQTADMERPKSLNINSNSPSGGPKSHPDTPNKGLSKNCSPLTKTEDFPPDSAEAHQQQQQVKLMAFCQRLQVTLLLILVLNANVYTVYKMHLNYLVMAAVRSHLTNHVIPRCSRSRPCASPWNSANSNNPTS